MGERENDGCDNAINALLTCGQPVVNNLISPLESGLPVVFKDTTGSHLL